MASIAEVSRSAFVLGIVRGTPVLADSCKHYERKNVRSGCLLTESRTACDDDRELAGFRSVGEQ